MKSRRILFGFVVFAMVLCAGCSSTTSRADSSSESSSGRETLTSLSAKVETSMLLDESFSLYLKGSWDHYASSVRLERESDFVFSGALPELTPGTYSYYTLIGDDENYREIKTYTHTFFSYGEELFHHVNGYILLPEEERVWSMENGKNGHIVEKSGSELTIENYSWLSGFAMRECTDVTGASYEVKAHFKGTKRLPAQDETYIGFVPYYRDAENYLVCYVQWCDWDGYANCIREIGMTGFIDGVDAGWNDIWNPLSVSTSPADGFALDLIREGSRFTISFTGDDGQSFSGSLSLPRLGDSLTSKLGIFVSNDAVEVADFKASDFIKEEVNYGFEVVGSVDNLDLFSASSFTVTNSRWCDGFVLREEASVGDKYTLQAVMQGTKSAENAENVYIGLVPYYRDEANYLFVYLQWTNGKLKSVGCTGFQNGVSLGWNDYWSFQNLTIAPSDAIELSCAVDATKQSLTVSLSGIYEEKTFSLIDRPGNKVGAYCMSDTVSYTHFEVIQ